MEKVSVTLCSVSTFYSEKGCTKRNVENIIDPEETFKVCPDCRFKQIIQNRWAFDYLNGHCKVGIMDLMDTEEFRGDINDLMVLSAFLEVQDFIERANDIGYLDNNDFFEIAIDFSEFKLLPIENIIKILEYFEVDFGLNIVIIYSDIMQEAVEQCEDWLEAISGLSDLDCICYHKLDGRGITKGYVFKDGKLDSDEHDRLLGIKREYSIRNMGRVPISDRVNSDDCFTEEDFTDVSECDSPCSECEMFNICHGEEFNKSVYPVSYISEIAKEIADLAMDAYNEAEVLKEELGRGALMGLNEKFINLVDAYKQHIE